MDLSLLQNQPSGRAVAVLTALFEGTRGWLFASPSIENPPLFHTARHGRWAWCVCVAVAVCVCVCWCWQILLVRNHTLSATPASATLARDASLRSAPQ